MASDAGARRDAAFGTVDVSIIIVNWNVRDLLRACIQSIDSTKGGLITQVIVVDNDSVDDSVAMVRAEFPAVRLIENPANLGFAEGSNAGLGEAIGKYVFFLNPDTVLKEEALIRLVEFLEANDDFVAVGPRLVNPDGTVQRTCARVPPSLGLAIVESLYLHRLPVLGQRLRDRLISPYDLDASQEVEAISGAAMLVHRTALTNVESFDTSFLYTGEDVDLCIRLRNRGGKIFYVADSEVTHLGGQSSSQARVRAETMSILSAATYFERLGGRRQANIYRLSVQVFQMPILLLVGLMKVVFRRAGPDELRERMRFAKAIWRWRVSE